LIKNHIQETETPLLKTHVWGKNPNILEISESHHQVDCDMSILISQNFKYSHTI